MMAKEFTALYLRNGMQNETSATTYAIRNTQYVLVLAYGNPLRRDDGVGWVIGERLAELLPEEAVDVRVLHQLTPELAEPISRAERVIFVDAAEPARRMNSASDTENPLKRVVAPDDSDDEPGAIHWTEIQPSSFTAQPFTHQVDPASLLAAAQELFGYAPPLICSPSPAQISASARGCQQRWRTLLRKLSNRFTD